MKIILTGSTGGIGSEVLQQCLQHPSITSIVALSRRPLPVSVTADPKLTVVIMDDFLTYSDSVLRQLDGAQACIWALGGPAFRYPDAATARTVNLDYTTAAATAFAALATSNISSSHNKRKFHFIFTSGAAIERDQSKKLWIMKDSRQIKGEAENQLMRLEREQPDTFAAFLLQVGSVVPKNSKGLLAVAVLTQALYPYITVDELAAAMIEIAVKGAETQTLTNAELVGRGKALLKR